MLLFREQEAHHRSLVKAISWRALGSLDTFVLSWIVTGDVKSAGAIASIETITKVGLFYLHERAWGKVRWGRSVSAPVHEPARENARQPV